MTDLHFSVLNQEIARSSVT